MYLEENSKGNPRKKSENTSLFDSTKQGQSLFTDKANDCVAHDKLAFINCIIINFIFVDSTNLKVLVFLAVLKIP